MRTGGAAKAILGGWQMNGIFGAYQRNQYGLSASGTSMNMPSGNAQTPDQIKPVIEKLGNYGDLPNFDTTAFARIKDVRFGNVGPYTMRGPGIVNLDLSLFRNFRITEELRSEFRIEAFNISNTPHFANPQVSITSSNFGKTTSTWTSGPGDSRSFRLGLRLTFQAGTVRPPGAG